MHADDYGVSYNDTTLDLVAQHATFIQNLVQKSDLSYLQTCKVDCWVPTPGSLTSAQLTDSYFLGESSVSNITSNATLAQRIPQDPPTILHNTCVSLPQACALSWSPGGIRRTQILNNNTGSYRSSQLVLDYSGNNTGPDTQQSYQPGASQPVNASSLVNTVQAASAFLHNANTSLESGQYPELSSSSVISYPAEACRIVLSLNATSWVVSTPDPPVAGSPSVVLKLSCLSDGTSRLSPLPPSQLTQNGDLIQPGLGGGQTDQQWQRVYSSQSECCSAGKGAFAPLGCS